MSSKDESNNKETPSETKNPQNGVPSSSRRNFLKYTGSGVIGFAVASVIEYPYLSNQVAQKDQKISTLNSEVSSLNSKVSDLEGQVSTLQGTVSQDESQITNLQNENTALQDSQTNINALSALSVDHATLVESLVEFIIPSETDSPGAKEAGVINFIDRQLAGAYGKNGWMYNQGPFIKSGLSGPITVDGITYPEGTMRFMYAGQWYQYPIKLRDFWRFGLDALQSYSNSAYGGNFESLSDTDKQRVLTDISTDIPTNFNNLVPHEFFGELVFMTWSGFLMDPRYGGNKNMVGWVHTGFSGARIGILAAVPYHVEELMVADHPTRLSPQSLGEFQKSRGIVGG